MRVFFAVMVVALLATASALVGCSPDIEEEEDEAIVTEEQLPPEPISLFQPPHWRDGTITIRTGVYETGGEMEDALWNRENFHARNVSLRIDIRKIPMSNVPKEVEVTVLRLHEVGIKGTAKIEKIRSRFGVEGYRPLTLEEAVMIRLDFTDQPDLAKIHHKMTSFYTLLSQKDGEFLWGSAEGERTLGIERAGGNDFIGAGNLLFFIDVRGVNFSPGAAFACVKVP